MHASHQNGHVQGLVGENVLLSYQNDVNGNLFKIAHLFC